jgi:hypothetical protein
MPFRNFFISIHRRVIPKPQILEKECFSVYNTAPVMQGTPREIAENVHLGTMYNKQGKYDVYDRFRGQIYKKYSKGKNQPN